MNRILTITRSFLLAVVMLWGFHVPAGFAAVPSFNPGDAHFPYSNNNAVPDGTFPYANQGLEAGLDAVEDKLPQGIEQQRSFTQLVKDWVNYFMQFYTVVTVGMLMYYGVQIIASREKTDKRKEVVTAIINILLGTLLMVFAYAIIIALINLATPTQLRTGVFSMIHLFLIQ